MKKYLGEYVLELTILLLGAVAGLLEAIVVDRTDIALLVGLTAFLLALAVLSIRQELSRQLRGALLDSKIIDQIPDAQWQREAQAEIDEVRVKLAAWAGGTRRVAERSSLNHQIAALSTARFSVRAVHLALESEALEMWGNPQRGFDHLVEAYRALPDHLLRQRILVLDADDPAQYELRDGQRTITDPTMQRVCQLQRSPTHEGGLGFDLRIRWVPARSRDITDMLIIDDREVCSIESYGHGQFGDLEVCVNKTIIELQIRRFEDLWTEAVPVHHCLPNPS